ncbi:FAD-dependent monooxygenase [Methylocella sp. CPCC 101449]|uniref:FAD-dependent oxidoreductase n=1 Tax=Methylocella sp. CPCC 101449 TaxID=2987531 RepID=UPI00288D983F|nr:FAD-dependent monooxygenase [Methylocella sp. CPCC 101449]MDT2020658.1 FAD-dependent monooxygenase [Methylocella sp. CPCC 101449]
MEKNALPVVIAGAGPVGMVAAADLVRQGVPVTVLEAGAELSGESRASTFHPPTLDMLDDLGFAKTLIAQGLKAPQVQYASMIDGQLGTFDFADIADLTRHPFRLQAEQFKLTRIILEALRDNPLFTIRFSAELKGLSQDEQGVDLTFTGPNGDETLRCAWLIGADGANSIVRRSQDIPFEGFTWAERFLVITTPADVEAERPGVTSVSYWADPQRWHFFLRIMGAWRIMIPVPPDIPDDTVTSTGFARDMLVSILPKAKDAPILHTTLYRVHQRVADHFRKGRTFLAGDAAHINNPLGGMGMNGGVHDALNLTHLLGPVIKGEADASTLEAYERQRRAVTMDAIQNGTIRNKRNLEAKTPEDRQAFRDEIKTALSSLDNTRAFLRRIAMFDSLERAAKL